MSQIEVISRMAETSFRRPPVLFVHGAFHGAWCWEEHFLPHFAARGLDAHALSLRGHGKSAGHEQLDTLGLEDFCADLDQACSDLRTPPVLVGHSTGAIVVQQYVQTHEVPGVVMLAPTALAPMVLAKLRWLLRFPRQTSRALITGDVNHVLPTLRFNFFSPEMPEDRVDRYMASMQRESKRLFREISRLRNPNPRGVRIPTLILASEQDRIPQRVNQRLAASFGADLHTLPMPHDMMLDLKWQMAADRIVEWIMALDRPGDHYR